MYVNLSTVCSYIKYSEENNYRERIFYKFRRIYVRVYFFTSDQDAWDHLENEMNCNTV